MLSFWIRCMTNTPKEYVKETIMFRGYLFHWRWLSMYLNGEFCTIEIDIRLFGVTYTHQFFTRKGFYNYFSNKVRVYKVSDSILRGNNIDIHV
jgi:hypothetical protein